MVPSDIAERAQELMGDLEVGGAEGCGEPTEEEGLGGGEVPDRFQRKKKYRTGSISGEWPLY